MSNFNYKIFEKNNKILILNIKNFLNEMYILRRRKPREGKTLKNQLSIIQNWKDESRFFWMKSFKKYLSEILKETLNENVEKVIAYRKSSVIVNNKNKPNFTICYGELYSYIKSKIQEIMINSNNCYFIVFKNKEEFIKKTLSIENIKKFKSKTIFVETIWKSLLK